MKRQVFGCGRYAITVKDDGNVDFEHHGKSVFLTRGVAIELGKLLANIPTNDGPAPAKEPANHGKKFMVKHRTVGLWMRLDGSEDKDEAEQFDPELRPYFEARPQQYVIHELPPPPTPLELAVKLLEEITDPYGPGYSLIVDKSRETLAKIRKLQSEEKADG